MGGEQTPLSGPDLAQGVPLDALADGAMLLGHAFGEPVLLARRGAHVFAIGATCTHYSGPLADGLMVGETVRCPWHHACFSLRTGEAVRAPALNPVASWQVERRGERVVVTGKRETTRGAGADAGGPPQVQDAARASATASSNHRAASRPAAARRVVIVGAGAAGNAAAEMLRRIGFDGELTMVGAEPDLPYDRPNLSKDYLAGSAPEEWIPLRGRDFYEGARITLRLGAAATAIDPMRRRVVLADGASLEYDALLLATGADPVRLPLPGGDLPHVRYLRSLADSRAIIQRADRAKRALVMGASFIGLEVAAALRARGLSVDVVAPEARPLERIMGAELGDFIRGLHEDHGVRLHLGQTAASVDEHRVTLQDGASVDADLVVVGVGVRPATALAESAGLALDRGVVVDEYLETSAPGIFAAGDIARWPDPHSGERIRVEHWVVAERQGQIAAHNILGQRTRCDIVPFFWSQHYDVQISYVGHAERWDRIEVDGRLADRDATAAFRAGNRTLAVATISRDRTSLQAEVLMERNDWSALRQLTGGSEAPTVTRR